MNQPISRDTLSRIDKLFMDHAATNLKESFARRTRQGLQVRVGDDVVTSYGLQLALLTAVNLGVKCFAAHATVVASADVWLAPCLVPMVRAATLGDAVAELGGTSLSCKETKPSGRYLILGNAEPDGAAIRITYDGWRIAVGPHSLVPRLAERPYCPLAAIAAAAIAVGEVFAEFSGISLTATRRMVAMSLWRPDLPWDHPDGIGEQISELPRTVAVFGLGHLGQAYLWALSALPYSVRDDITVLLCDDDIVEKVNIETGALLTTSAVHRPKTRVAAEWLEARGFRTKLLERWVDENFRRTAKEPVIALSGFDDNRPRQWLSQAGFAAIFDSGLGGEAHNFDTIGFHAWPNPRVASDVWPLESEQQAIAREARSKRRAESNAAYLALNADECGRLLLAEESVAVPFVGATAACIVLAEMIKAIHGGPTFNDLKLRLCTLGTGSLEGSMDGKTRFPIRGLATQAATR